MSSSTPSIRISQHSRYASPPSSYSSIPSAAASPMGIPGAQDPVPPPLPPPVLIPELSSGRDVGWQWGNDPNSTDFGRPASVREGSSLLGGSGFRSPHQEKENEYTRYHGMNDARRGSSISTVTASRDHEMTDDHQSHNEEDSGSSRPGSNYRCVHLVHSAMAEPTGRHVESIGAHHHGCSVFVSRRLGGRLGCIATEHFLILTNSRLQSERRLEQTTLEGSSQAYDKQLLSRIGGPNTPDSKRQSVSHASSAQENVQLGQADNERRNSQLRPLAMPGHERRHSSIASISSIDSPGNARWAPSVPSSGAISPGYTGFFERSPVDSSRLHSRTNSIAFEDSASHRGSYDHSIFTNDEYSMEDSQMSNLNLHDRSPSGSEDYANSAKAGDKRRASSPPRDFHHQERASISSASGQNDLFHRRSMQQLPNRSPVARHYPHHGSLSSTSSYAPRHGSLGSSLGVASIPSSATSYGSGRVSPLGLSPAALDPELRAGAPYGSGKPLSRSPIMSNPQHQRAFSGEISNDAQRSDAGSRSHSRQNSLTQLQGLWICECCPKKPKKFDTEDDLR